MYRYTYYILLFEAVVAQDHACDCNATVANSIATRGNELLFINIFISTFWYPKAQR